MSITNSIYRHHETTTDSYRYVLGEWGHRNLVFVGVNPSTATDKMHDPTIRKAIKFAANNGYDGWVMINLYPQRATDPNNLHVVADTNARYQNMMEILQLFESLDRFAVCCCWGNLVEKRKYLMDCVVGLANVVSNPTYSLGEVTKSGHPRHPLYLGYETNLIPFDLEGYADSMKARK